MALSIKKDFNESNKCWEFKVSGEIDISSSDLFRDALNSAYTKTPANITINLAGLTYMDSTGLGVIIGNYGKIKRDGYTVTLLEPRENIKKLLRITNLDKVLL